MKTSAQSDFARDLPSLLVTATISAACVIALAAFHALLTGGGSKPAATTAARVDAPAKVVQLPEVAPAVEPKATPKIPAAETKQPAATTSAKPVDLRLSELQTEYEREREEFRQAVAVDLAQRETAARESADPEALKRATAARDAFYQGIVPNDAPEPALSELLRVREQVVAALKEAALDKELTDFQARESTDVGNVIQRFPKCIFRLINLETGLALAAKSTGRGSAVIQAKEDPANLLQHWYVAYHGKQPHLKNRGAKTTLNVPGGNLAGGVKIILWDDKSTEFNSWEMQYRGSYYYIRSNFSGKLLSVPASKKEEGLQLIQWPHHDAPDDQKWKLVRVLTETEES